MYKQTTEQWNVLVPKLQTLLIKYTKDEILVRKVENLLNKLDKLILEGETISDLIRPIYEVLESDTYYVNIHKYSSEEEKSYLRALVPEFETLLVLAESEEKFIPTPKAASIDRLPNTDESSVFDKPNKTRDRIR